MDKTEHGTERLTEQNDNKKTISTIVIICTVAVVVIGLVFWLNYPRTPSGDTRFVLTGSSTSTTLASLALGSTSSTIFDPNATSTTLDPAALAALNQTQNQEVTIVYGGPEYQVGPDNKLIRVNPQQNANPNTGKQSQSQIVVIDNMPKTSLARSTTSIRQREASRAPNPAVAQSTSSTQYWIQIIASTNRDRVEQVRTDMSQLGFNGRVSTKVVSGQEYYRLRYGPYGQKQEAGKFLDWVKVIKGYEASYLTEEYKR